MEKKNIEVCKGLCIEFIKRADVLLKSYKKHEINWNGDVHEYETYSSKDSGALRRMSMELTRALADMRRS